MSIVPRTVSASVPIENPQSVNAMRTESGTRSPSAFAGDAGLRVGMQNPSPDPNGVIGAPSPGRNIPLDRVAPSSSLWASAATASPRDRKSTRLNSSHLVISYAVFCLKKKKEQDELICRRHSAAATLE